MNFKRTKKYEVTVSKTNTAKINFLIEVLLEELTTNLYNSAFMPTDLLKAHQQLDTLVDTCYCDTPFKTESKRVEFLFELHDTYTSGMFPR